MLPRDDVAQDLSPASAKHDLALGIDATLPGTIYQFGQSLLSKVLHAGNVSAVFFDSMLRAGRHFEGRQKQNSGSVRLC
jgi:hypothetical protein